MTQLTSARRCGMRKNRIKRRGIGITFFSSTGIRNFHIINFL